MNRCVCFFVVMIAHACFAQDSLPELVKRTTPAVVTIVCKGSLGQDLKRGTGFFISPTLVATNHHVIEGASGVTIKLSEGKVIDVDGLGADDPVHDLAIVVLKSPVSDVRPLTLRTAVPEPGERVVVIGSPLGELEHSVSDGIVSAVREYGTYGKVIQTTAAASPGSSGSPVLTPRGDVVGVITFARIDGQSLNFAIPVARLAELKVGPSKPFRLVLPPLTSTPIDVPTGILGRLSAAQRALVEEQRPGISASPTDGA